MNRKPEAGLVSVCIPVHNAGKYLAECLLSVMQQSYAGPLEVSLFDDASSDDSAAIALVWETKFLAKNFRWVFSSSTSTNPRGEGYARNRAIEQCHGEYICTMDADDVMLPTRIETQLRACKLDTDALVGSNFERIPADATAFYTQWANNLTQRDLVLQQYREVTLIHPTWFWHCSVWEAVGGYEEQETDGSIALAADMVSLQSCPHIPQVLTSFSLSVFSSNISRLVNLYERWRRDWFSTATM
jgi:glycosyltransferase involved in cell wall biosynthesis